MTSLYLRRLLRFHGVGIKASGPGLGFRVEGVGFKGCGLGV